MLAARATRGAETADRNRGSRVEEGRRTAREEGTAMAAPDRVGYWNKTRNLMLFMLALWIFFSFIVHMFVEQLNSIVILGFPLGFYMAAQGSLIAFVVMLFWFARSQNAIDEEYGVDEE